MARWLITVEIEAATWVSSFSSLSVPLWKKSNNVFSKANTKDRVQSFSFITKLSCSEPLQSSAGVGSCWADPHGHVFCGRRECDYA